MVTMEDVPVPNRKKTKGVKNRLVEKVHPETGNVLMTYGSVAIAAIKNHIHSSTIYESARTGKEKCGYIWRYKEE